MSALPSSLAATAPAAKRARSSTSKGDIPDAWKSIVSCDYCTLHWHLDCLDPPLPTLPPFNKKWMCPNHAERVLVSPNSTSLRLPDTHSVGVAAEASYSQAKCPADRNREASTVQ